MTCPHCSSAETVVAATMKMAHVVTRHRICDACGCQWQTDETVRLVLPNTKERPPPGSTLPNGREPGQSSSLRSGSDSGDLQSSELSGETVRQRDQGPVKDSTPVVMTFVVTGGSKVWALHQSRLDEFKAAFPGMDVMGEFRKAGLWLINNSTKRKTPRGMGRFLQNWLESSQNRYGGRAQPVQLRSVPKPDSGLCAFHGIHDNAEKFGPRFYESCSECRHTKALKRPRDSSEPQGIGDIAAGGKK